MGNPSACQNPYCCNRPIECAPAQAQCLSRGVRLAAVPCERLLDEESLHVFQLISSSDGAAARQTFPARSPIIRGRPRGIVSAVASSTARSTE